MNDSTIHRINEEDVRTVYENIGSTRTERYFMEKDLNDLKLKIEKVQEEIITIKITSEVTKVKLMFYGVIGGSLYSIVLYFIKTFLIEA